MTTTRIQLSDHFTYGRLLRFVAPSIVMMLFLSVYTVVDGLFISNFAGKEPLAAINLIWPLFMITGAVGFMLGVGGNALVAKTMGEGDAQKANEYFSLFVYVGIGVGAVLAVICVIILEPVSIAFGAEDVILDQCVSYGRILCVSMPFFMAQNMFQSFFIAAEKPNLGLACTVIAGCINIALDALFVAGFGWKLEGAAWATAAGEIFGGIFPIIYFLRKNDSRLKLTRTKFYFRALRKACFNGLSEMMMNVASSIIVILYNIKLLEMIGEDGVAAFGVVGYLMFIFIAVFLGFTMGASPIISFHFGAKNREEQRNLFRKSLILCGLGGIAIFVLAELTAVPLSVLFVGYDQGLLDLTIRAMRIYSISYIITGINIFSSAYFTALNDGLTSALIAFLRTLVFQVAAIFILPLIFGVDGIWAAVIASEGLSFLVAVLLLKTRGMRSMRHDFVP